MNMYSNLIPRALFSIFSSFLVFFVFSFLSPSFPFSTIYATRWVKTYALDGYVGPEIYWVKRIKETGAKQSGPLYGVRAGYDHIYRYKWYWGVEAFWARGTLTGKSRQDPLIEDRIKSIFTDSNVEARFGYTFQSKYWRCLSFTPYFGGGYFWEYNNYISPSPLHIHCKNTFSYIPVGFFSQVFITPKWSIGLNAKVRYILEGQHHVSNDPKYPSLKQQYEEKLQYRVELPITYFYCWKKYSLGASLVPFYEYRSYGHRANYPFDFLRTDFELFGATLKLLYLF